MESKVIIYIGFGILVILGIYCWLGIKKAYSKGEALPIYVSIAIWVCDTVHGFLVILSTLYSIWLLPFNRKVALISGSVISGVGLAIMLVGMFEFRYFKKISGLDTTKLVATGIYRWSRNPQYTGWFILLLGISLIGRSGLSFLFTIVFIVAIHLYNVMLEEPYLEKIFGKEYCLYKSITPRYVRIPKGRTKNR